MDLTEQNLQSIMRFRPTLKDTAAIVCVSEDTIERRIREWENCTFADFKERHSSHVKHKLIDRAFEMALNGNATMMIFCLKNMCGWLDKAIEQTPTNENDLPVLMLYKDDPEPANSSNFKIVRLNYSRFRKCP
jgi:hypothetical protein